MESGQFVWQSHAESTARCKTPAIPHRDLDAGRRDKYCVAAPSQQTGRIDMTSTTVVDRVGAEANRAFDSGSTWLGIDVVFATGTNAADVQDRAIRATAIR
jgi:hypothetical protein